MYIYFYKRMEKLKLYFIQRNDEPSSIYDFGLKYSDWQEEKEEQNVFQSPLCVFDGFFFDR